MAKEPSGEWWAVITHQFQAHVREEEEFIEAYERLAADVTDPGTRFLITLIVEDERRHHDLMEQMAATARGDATPGNAAPEPPRLSVDEARRLLGATEHFLEAEKEDRDRLKELARHLRPAREDTLWHLLVQLMDLDTAKHITILQYLRDRLREAARG